MKRNMSFCLLLAGTFGGVLPGTAETVYRCGDAYSQQPCPGGTAVQADDPRSESQRAQTRDAAKRDAKVAEEMQKSRLKEEAKPVHAIMPEPKLEAPEPPANPAVSGVAKKPAYFTAVQPAKKKTKKAAVPAKAS